MILHDADEGECKVVPVDNFDISARTECKILYSSFTDFLRDYIFQKKYNEADTMDYDAFRKNLGEQICISEKLRFGQAARNSSAGFASDEKQLVQTEEYARRLSELRAEALDRDRARTTAAYAEASKNDARLEEKNAWEKMDSSTSHSYLSKILTFLRKLEIDVSVFKKRQGYCYTRELVGLFRRILDTPSYIRTQYQKARFSKIPLQEAHELYMQIVAAIQSIPDSSTSTREKKNEQIEHLRKFLSKQYKINIQEIPPRDLVLDAIFNSVWFFSMVQCWARKSKSIEFARDDRDWQCVVDHVYIDLYRKQLIFREDNETTTGDLKICKELPNRYESQRIKHYWESTEFNPNIVSPKETMLHKSVHPVNKGEQKLEK